jgi:RNA polymerase sigma factor for flagellar operon FliA
MATSSTKMSAKTSAKTEDLALLWERFQKSRDGEAREQLILSYVSLVKYSAGRLAIFFKGYYEMDDLISAGIPGLIKAVDRYNPGKNVKFETFASIKIRGAILDWVRSFSWVPRSVYAESRRVEQAIAALEQKLGRTPDDSEVAEYLEITADQYRHTLEKIAPVTLLSLDGIQQQGQGLAVEELERDGGAEGALDSITFEETKQELADGISRLPEKEKLVVSLYYYDGLSLKEIGKVLGVTESRISQLHTQAVLRLRRFLTADS